MISKQTIDSVINELKLLSSKRIIVINSDEYIEDFIENNLKYYFEIEYLYLDDLSSIEPTKEIFIFNIDYLDSKYFELIDYYIRNSEFSIFYNIKENISSIKSKINPIWKNIILSYKTKELSILGFVYPNYSDYYLKNSFNLVKVKLNDTVPMNPNIYNDNITLFKNSFEELNILYSESFNELKKDKINILFLPFSTDEFTSYASKYDYIVIQFEQIAFVDNFDVAISHNRYKSYIQLMKNAVCIWDYSKLNIQYLNKIGFNNVKYLPIGFHEKLNILNKNRTKDIDILFYGALNDRRINILDNLKKYDINIKILTNSYDLERNSYIERAKIVLNINWNEQTILAEHRLSFLLNNNCFVISELPQSDIPDYYNKGIVFCSRENIVNTCLFYLALENDKLRDFVSNKGFTNFSKNRMIDNLRAVLGLKRT